MNVLIVNSYPVNGGDEALLRAAISGVQSRWPDAKIKVLCGAVDRSQRAMPDLQLDADLEDLPRAAARPLHRTCERIWRGVSHIPGLARASFLLERKVRNIGRRTIEKHYREADIVLSAPGGFFHDYYDIQGRLSSLEFAVHLGKPVFLFAQSVGPFWKPESLTRVREVFGKLTAICVRDEASREHLRDCGISDARVRVTGDAVFLLRDRIGPISRPERAERERIGLCFRAWPHTVNGSLAATIEKAQRLSEHLLSHPARELYFISTCQGVPGYIDDSEIAVQVVDRLPPQFKARCTVDRGRNMTSSLVAKLATCDLFVGMRLHSCLLAMLAGTPAAGLGYEAKTREIFTQMGLEDYQVPYEAPYADWQSCVDRLLLAVPSLRATLPTAVAGRTRAAEANLDVLAAWMEQISPQSRNGAYGHR